MAGVLTFLQGDNNPKITAGCTSSNTSMIKLLKRGHDLEGRRIRQEIHDDVAVDILLYGKFALQVLSTLKIGNG